MATVGSSTTVATVIVGSGFQCNYTPPQCPVLNAAPPEGAPVQVALNTGNNTVAVPAGAIGVLLVPPVGSTNSKILKGVNADTGIAMATGQPFMMFFAPSATSFVINAAGAETLLAAWL